MRTITAPVGKNTTIASAASIPCTALALMASLKSKPAPAPDTRGFESGPASGPGSLDPLPAPEPVPVPVPEPEPDPDPVPELDPGEEPEESGPVDPEPMPGRGPLSPMPLQKGIEPYTTVSCAWITTARAGMGGQSDSFPRSDVECSAWETYPGRPASPAWRRSS